MNLAWVLLLAVGVLAEKTIPAGKTLSNLIGAILIIFGCYSIYGYFVTDGKAPLKMMAMECMKMDDMKMDKMGTD